MSSFLGSYSNNEIVISKLLEIIKENKFQSFTILVAYSQVDSLKRLLNEIDYTNKEVTIVVTIDGLITDPESLDRLMHLNDDATINIECRVYDSEKTGGIFHPKIFYFEFSDVNKIVIGSTNISKSAFNDNIEANWYTTVAKDSVEHKEIYEFRNHILDNSKTIDQKLIDEYQLSYNREHKLSKLTHLSSDFEYNEMQLFSLWSVKNQRKAGITRTIQIAATGTGKTIFAISDIFNYIIENPNKKINVLFATVNRTIIKQAFEAFHRLLSHRKNELPDVSMRSFVEVVNIDQFKTENMINIFFTTHMFAKNIVDQIKDVNFFDYIIIDECHHLYENEEKGLANIVSEIVNKFKPKFLLGLTATPRRKDFNLVSSVFDKKITANFDIEHSIQKKLITNFEYFVVPSNELKETKISDFVANFDVVDAQRVVEQIHANMYQGDKLRAIAFVNGVENVKRFSSVFNMANTGYKSDYIVGETPEDKRALLFKSIQSSTPDSVNIIFSDKALSEGIDIPSVNALLIFRVTDSPILFLQQLGRGLRLDPKSHNKVLYVYDFATAIENNYKVITNELFKNEQSVSDVIGNVVRASKVPNKPKQRTVKGYFSLHIVEHDRKILLGYIRRYQRDYGFASFEDSIFDVIASNADTFALEGVDKQKRIVDKGYIPFEHFDSLSIRHTMMDLFNSKMWFTKIYRSVGDVLTKEQSLFIELVLKSIGQLKSQAEVNKMRIYLSGQSVLPFENDFVNSVLLKKQNQKAYIASIPIWKQLSEFLELSLIRESEYKAIVKNFSVFDNDHWKMKIAIGNGIFKELIISITSMIDGWLFNWSKFELSLSKDSKKFYQNIELINKYSIGDAYISNNIFKIEDKHYFLNLKIDKEKDKSKYEFSRDGITLKTKQIGNWKNENISEHIDSKFDIFIEFKEESRKLELGSATFTEQYIEQDDNNQFTYVFKFDDPYTVDVRTYLENRDLVN